MLAGQLIKEINGLVKILTNDDNMSVQFHENESCTDGQTIVLPEISLTETLTKKRVSAIRGLVDHECGHVRHTDMETMGIAEERNNSRMLKLLLNVIDFVFAGHGPLTPSAISILPVRLARANF